MGTVTKPVSNSGRSIATQLSKIQSIDLTRLHPPTTHGHDDNLHGVDRVTVVDASIMPDIPRTNTILSTMKVARHISAQRDRS